MLKGAEEFVWPVESDSFMPTLQDCSVLFAVCSATTLNLLDQTKTFLETVLMPCQDEQPHTALASVLFTCQLFFCFFRQFPPWILVTYWERA